MIIVKRRRFDWLARFGGVETTGVQAEYVIARLRALIGPIYGIDAGRVPALIYTRIHGIHD